MKMLHEPTLSEALQCARICHEVNRAYCFSIGDSSQGHWHNATDAVRSAVLNVVREHIASGLTLTAEQAHERWLVKRKGEGWKYGDFDAEKKRHPNLVPYIRLPPEQRTKDWLFRAAVHAFFHDHFGN